jgi:hypothetical protein
MDTAQPKLDADTLAILDTIGAAMTPEKVFHVTSHMTT